MALEVAAFKTTTEVAKVVYNALGGIHLVGMRRVNLHSMHCVDTYGARHACLRGIFEYL